MFETHYKIWFNFHEFSCSEIISVSELRRGFIDVSSDLHDKGECTEFDAPAMYHRTTWIILLKLMKNKD